MEYERKFPGLRFMYVEYSIVRFRIADLYSTFVNGRSRALIIVEMRQRIDHIDLEGETIEIV